MATFTVNGKTVKPSYDVKIGDIIEVHYGSRVTKFRVVAISETTKKSEASEMYEVLE